MPVTTRTPREVAARYHQAMLDKSADDLADLYTADAIHEFPFTTPGGLSSRYHGREEVRAGYRAAWGAMPAHLEEIRDVVVYETTDPEVLVVEQVAAGTVATTGEPFAIPGLLVLRVRDGELVHVRDYSDALGAAKAMGYLPDLVAGMSGQPEPTGTGS